MKTKTKAPVAHNVKTSKSLKSAKAAIDAKIDPQLAEICKNWDAEKRFVSAEKMRVWVHSLLSTAMQLELLEKIHAPGSNILN